MEFNVRVSRDTVTLTTVPKGYGKPGFVKRLPNVLAKRPKSLVEKFLGFELDPGTNTITVEKSRNGKFIVGDISFGNRSGKKYEGPDEVVYKSKVVINRDNGIGIRLCFIPDDLAGKRVDIY